VRSTVGNRLSNSDDNIHAPTSQTQSQRNLPRIAPGTAIRGVSDTTIPRPRPLVPGATAEQHQRDGHDNDHGPDKRQLPLLPK
jgi:hypothetical protein